MSKKILLVINSRDREIVTINKIENAILKLQPDAIIEIDELYKKGFIKRSLKFHPDIIMTFPFTGLDVHHSFYIIKFCTNCAICCFRTEGFSVSGLYDIFVGIGKYCNNIVDREIFWGSEMASYVGNKLLSQNKLKSDKQIAITGYPKYEDLAQELNFANTDKRQKDLIESFDKKKRILFLTGFNYADYSKEDLFLAGDLELSENKLQQWLNVIEATKRMRNIWIEKIISCARENSDHLFIVKMHPSEISNIATKGNPYEKFLGLENILMLKNELTTIDLMKISGILFHYGSTAVTESYVTKIPSVMLRYNCQEFQSEVGSHFLCEKVLSDEVYEVEEAESAVRKYIQNEIKYHKDEEKAKIMKNIFNMDITEDIALYNPSLETAKIILELKNPSNINFSNKFLQTALIYKRISKIKLLFRLVKCKILNFFRKL